MGEHVDLRLHVVSHDIFHSLMRLRDEAICSLHDDGEHKAVIFCICPK